VYASRALVDLEQNVRKLAAMIANKDKDALQIINLILQDAYVVKDALLKYEVQQIDAFRREVVDAQGSEQCKASPMIYAHIKS
jgi:hypothetical protein